MAELRAADHPVPAEVLLAAVPGDEAQRRRCLAGLLADGLVAALEPLRRPSAGAADAEDADDDAAVRDDAVLYGLPR